MTAPNDGKGNPLEESPEAARVRQALEESPEAARFREALEASPIQKLFEESPEAARLREALEASPLNFPRTPLHSIFNPPPEPDYRGLLEALQREADHRRAYEDAVIELARQQARPDTALTSPPAAPQRELDKPEQGAAAKSAALAQLLDEIDRRAAEQDAGFDRYSLPGTKDEFARLLKFRCPLFRHIGPDRIAYYLKGRCRFQRGVKPEHGKGAAVWALFPEYDLSMGK